MNVQDKLPIKAYELSSKRVIEPLPEGAKNIVDILHADPNPTKCMITPFFLATLSF